MLEPKVAQTMAVVLHELATNAAKYGALSSPEGRLDLSWQLDGLQEAALHLLWRERGGPRVTVPSRRGFGRTLIEQGLRHDVGGSVSMDFAPEGLVCAITIPAAHALVPNGAETAAGEARL